MKNEPNQVVTDAVAALNQQNAENVKRQAMTLMDKIGAQRNLIEGCRSRIAASRKSLGQIAENTITEASVFGGSLPSNANRETILKVIEAANKDRQYQIDQASQPLSKSIINEQDAIVSHEKQIEKLIEELASLTNVPITIEQVMG